MLYCFGRTRQGCASHNHMGNGLVLGFITASLYLRRSSKIFALLGSHDHRERRA